jgi:glycosyltransferase involved in cell wall biosynthesis
MKVVLVSNTIVPDKVGGLPRYVRELATALARAGCDVVVLAKRVADGPPAREKASDGVTIIRHPVPPKSNPLFAAFYPVSTARGVLAPVHRARGPETIVHCHFAPTAFPLALTGLRFLYTFHAPVWRELLDERQGTYRLPGAVQPTVVAAVRASERLVVNRSPRLFVLSEFMRGQLAELSQAAGARAEVLAGGIDLDRFAPDDRTPRSDSGSPRLFTARRLTPRTGIDQLLSAMPEISRRHPRASLQIAGTGELEAELRALAGSLGVAERVTFLGQISESALVKCYSRATLVVIPTVKLEGFGLAAGEALACGTPVVGTPGGAIPELLRPVDPRLVARDSSPAALAAAVCGLLDDPVGLSAVAARCRARVEPALGWGAVAARYLEAYQEQLLQGRAIAGR